MVVPEAEKPEQGTISINFECTSLASSNARSGPPDEKSQSMSISVDNIVKNVVILDQLGIEKDIVSWALFVDIYCLEGSYFIKIVSYFCLDDGNVYDAALLATIKSLKCLELPSVEVETRENGTKRWKVDKENKKVALELKEVPISTTFGEFNGILLIDPTLKETQLGRFVH